MYTNKLEMKRPYMSPSRDKGVYVITTFDYDYV